MIMPRMEALERMLPQAAMAGLEGAPPPMPGPEDEGPIELPEVIMALEELVGSLPEEKRADVSKALDILRQVAADKPPSVDEEMSGGKKQEDGLPPAGEEGL